MTDLILYVIFACICAFGAFRVLSGKQDERRNPRHILIVVIVLPVASLVIYHFLGHPGLAGHPAAFIKDGPRFEQRQLVVQQRQLLRKMAKENDIPPASDFERLAKLQMKTGKPEQAILTLRRGRLYHADDAGLKRAFGQAYAIKAMRHRLADEHRAAQEALRKVRKYAPDLLKPR